MVEWKLNILDIIAVIFALIAIVITIVIAYHADSINTKLTKTIEHLLILINQKNDKL